MIYLSVIMEATHTLKLPSPVLICVGGWIFGFSFLGQCGDSRWRLKSPASRLFTQPFIRAQNKENIKAPRHLPLWGEFTGDRWFPAQRACNENISIWWRHHVAVTLNHVGFNLFKCHHEGCLDNPTFSKLFYVLHVEHVLCIIMNCGQYQWVILSSFSIAI